MRFVRTVKFNERIDRLKRMLLSSSIGTTTSDAFIRFVTDLHGVIVDNNFPVEGYIESVPMFVNANSFPAVYDPLVWLVGSTPLGTRIMIEFRTFNQEGGQDAGPYQSVSVESGSANAVDFPGTFSVAQLTDGEDMTVTPIADGWRIAVTGANAASDSVFFTQPAAGSPSTDEARYLSADMMVNRSGRFLQWNIDHGTEFGFEAIGNAPPPFNFEIDIYNKSFKQNVLWDLSEWPAEQSNFDYIRVLALKILDTREPFVLDLTNIKLVGIDDGTVAPAGAQALPVQPKRFIQYKATLTTQVVGITPSVTNAQFDVVSKPAVFPSGMLRGGKYFSNSNQLTYPERSGFDVAYEAP